MIFFLKKARTFRKINEGKSCKPAQKNNIFRKLN